VPHTCSVLMGRRHLCTHSHSRQAAAILSDSVSGPTVLIPQVSSCLTGERRNAHNCRASCDRAWLMQWQG